MEYPKFKETSSKLDEYTNENKKPKMWVVKKFFIHIGICFALAFIEALVEKSKKEIRFKKRYKTVIKENVLGFKSYEYHERE